MRSFCAAVAALLIAAAPAAADYRRLPGPAPDANLVVVDGTVYVGGGGALTAHAPDGSTRTIVMPGGMRFDWLDVSGEAAAAVSFPSSGGRVRAIYGRAGGPLRTLPFPWVNVDVGGPYVVVFSSRTGAVRVIDVRNGRERRFRIRGDLRQMRADKGFFAYDTGRHVVVRRLSNGREVYRVPSRGYYRLAAGGRVVTRGDESGRGVQVATPARPRWRTLSRIGLGSSHFDIGSDGILLVRGDARASSEVTLLGWDGRPRALTPLLRGVGAVAWDGRTMAFAVGDCVFAGPVPAAGAPLPPVAAEGCVRSSYGGAGR